MLSRLDQKELQSPSMISQSSLHRSTAPSTFNIPSLSQTKGPPTLPASPSQQTLASWPVCGRFQVTMGIWEHVPVSFTLWLWEKQRKLATATIGIIGSALGYQISFSHQDYGLMCVSTVGGCSEPEPPLLLRYTEGHLKYLPPSRGPKLPPAFCHCWLPDGRLLWGTDNARVVLWDFENEAPWEMLWLEQSEKQISEVVLSTAGCSLQSKRLRHVNLPGQHTSASRWDGVRLLVSFSRGAACVFAPQSACIVEKTDDKKFRPTQVFKIPSDPCSADEESHSGQRIVSLAFTPSEEMLVAITDRGRLYAAFLMLGNTNEVEESEFEAWGPAWHCKRITGLSVCSYRPLLATCSDDGAISVWNLQTSMQEVHCKWPGPALSISLHPFGFMVLVGFPQCLRLFSIFQADLRTVNEFSVQACHQVAYSHGGHLFAAASGNLIHLFSAVTLRNVSTLKGHISEVHGLAWSVDDLCLVTCSVEGRVYEWRVHGGKRHAECIIKVDGYVGLALPDSDRCPVYATTATTLREIAGSQVVKEVSLEPLMASAITVERLGRAIYVGTAGGVLRVTRLPLSTNPEWFDLPAHQTSITQMCVTPDNKRLITGGSDGSLFVWSLTEQEGQETVGFSSIPRIDEVLTSRSELVEKDQRIRELAFQLDEVQGEMDFQLRLQTSNFEEQQQKEKLLLSKKVEALNQQLKVISGERKADLERQRHKMSKMMEEQAERMQRTEDTLRKEMLVKIMNSKELESALLAAETKYKQQEMASTEMHTGALQELEAKHQVEMAKKDDEIDELREELLRRNKEWDEWLVQVEQDFDQEIAEMSRKHELQMKSESEAKQKLQAFNILLQRKCESEKKEVTKREGEVERLKVKNARREETITKLTKELEAAQTALREKDGTLFNKERSQIELKRKIKEQEKVMFVVSHRLEDLQRKAEPRSADLHAMHARVHEMEEELAISSKMVNSLAQKLTSVSGLAGAQRAQRLNHLQRAQQAEHRLQSLQAKVSACSDDLQSPRDLKCSVVRLLRSRLQNPTCMQEESFGKECFVELSRHKVHLEQCVATLRCKLSAQDRVHRKHRQRLVQENADLLVQLSALRREIKESREEHEHGWSREVQTTSQSEVVTVGSLTYSQTGSGETSSDFLMNELQSHDESKECRKNHLPPLTA
uniref:Cilia- and flagella-associated protein 57 n=1 Tax=Eptatretus burgeri TaxID=7764 RepID=A0A8C4QWQ8_EPTBU